MVWSSSATVSYCLGLSNHLRLPEHPCHFTSSCLGLHWFFWLEYHSESSGPLLCLSHDLVQISPTKVSPYLRPSKAKVFISSLLTLDLVQTLFRVFMILITYLCTHWLKKDESGTVTNAGNNTEKDAGWPPLLRSSHPLVITGWLPASPHPSQGRAGALLVSAFFFFISTKHRTGIQ